MRTLLALCHAGLVGMARQVIAVLTIMVVFSISDSVTFAPTFEIAQQTSAAEIWRSASLCLASCFVLVAFGLALTSGPTVNLAASRIAQIVGKSRLRRPKQLLVALSIQFGLGSILVAILALRAPCEIALISSCFSKPIYDVVLAAALSVVAAGCGANAHAIAKASRIIPTHRTG